MRNRKFSWLTVMTLTGVLFVGGCSWSTLHQLAIHTFAITDFLASLQILGFGLTGA
jgi:hypothetical protein